jgi:hypothetical protein
MFRPIFPSHSVVGLSVPQRAWLEQMRASSTVVCRLNFPKSESDCLQPGQVLNDLAAARREYQKADVPAPFTIMQACEFTVATYRFPSASQLLLMISQGLPRGQPSYLLAPSLLAVRLAPYEMKQITKRMR